MDARIVVGRESALDLQLLLQIGLKLRIYVVNYRLVAEKINIKVLNTTYSCYLSKILSK